MPGKMLIFCVSSVANKLLHFLESNVPSALIERSLPEGAFIVDAIPVFHEVADIISQTFGELSISS